MKTILIVCALVIVTNGMSHKPLESKHIIDIVNKAGTTWKVCNWKLMLNYSELQKVLIQAHFSRRTLILIYKKYIEKCNEFGHRVKTKQNKKIKGNL